VRISASGNVMVETAAPGVRVLRFERPDVRAYLDDDADIADSPLFREIEDVALTDLPKGWTLVLNLRLIRPINTAFYRCLLQIRQSVRARRARLVLCGLSREHREVFELFQAFRLFTVVRTEVEAANAPAAAVLPKSPPVSGRRSTEQQDRGPRRTRVPAAPPPVP
jgi:anti-anti-sigma regulatory factor